MSFSIAVQKWQLAVTWNNTGVISVGNLTLVYKALDVCVFTEFTVRILLPQALSMTALSVILHEIPPTSHAP